MKKIVSVSLGSTSGDFVREIELAGQRISLSREGTEGDIGAARARIVELDGKVDAIGLGGIDVYLYVGGEQFVIGDGKRLADAALITPVVDGSGLKNTLERVVVDDLFRLERIKAGDKVLMVSALDRFGMAEAFVDHGNECVFGDLIFNIGFDFPLSTLKEIEDIARKYRSRLLTVPFHMLYPTGAAQEVCSANPTYAKYYHDADVIAGDAHLILKHMPERVDGKGIVTNTTRQNTMSRFAEAGAAWVMTTTPNIDGLSSGTNVMEAVLVALLEKPTSEITADDYSTLIEQLSWRGSLTVF